MSSSGLRPPILSELDPLEQGEGSIDPLGLAATYERLADRMLENVTVRMGRIRFVTAVAVGTAVCSGWDEDERAADGVSSPWQVFEWATVIAFVRAREAGSASLLQVAGNQKVQRALRSKYAVSTKTYLKTPAIFGYGGIFRRFAVGTNVIGREGHLEEMGHALVRGWAQDQGLAGFVDGTSRAEGRQFFDQLRKVVDKGMKAGCLNGGDVPAEVATQLAARLDPQAIRPGQERDVLRSLVESQAGAREGAEFLARELRRRGGTLTPQEEAEFVRPLLSKAPEALRGTLEEVDAYEALCRPLTDTFDWIRHWASLRRGTPLTRSDFTNEARAALLLTGVREGIRRVREVDRLLVRDPAVRLLVDRFEDVTSTAELFDAVLEHHPLVQKEKLPNGKRPWVEFSSKGEGIVVRPSYIVEEPPAPASPYVHEYRLPTFSRFLADLGVMQ